MLPDYTLEAIELHHRNPDDKRNAQSLTLEWILQDPNLVLYDDNQLLQRFAMATFYFATIDGDGDDALIDVQDIIAGGTALGYWRNDTNWLSYNHDECKWFMNEYYTEENLSLDDDYVYDYQIKQVIPEGPCDEAGNLRHMWLSENGLKGSIPPELALLTSLRTVDLTSNDFSGTLPVEMVTQLSQLEVLFLYSEGLTGTLPTEIGLMSSLLHMELLATSLSGSLPSELGLLSSSLEVLVIDNSLISGRLPTQVGLLSKLNVMVLGSNQLTGTVPSELGQLTSVFDCCLYGNDLTGSLPSELSLLEDMRFFIFESNKLVSVTRRQMYCRVSGTWLTHASFPFLLC